MNNNGNKTAIIELLNNIEDFLLKYEITSGEYLTDVDMYDLKLAETTVVILKRHADELDKIMLND